MESTALKEAQLEEILFGPMPMGVAVFDNNLCLQRCNPTWLDFIVRYTATSPESVQPGAHLYELAPGSEESIGPILERVLAGETQNIRALRSVSGGIISYWDVVFSPLVEDGEVIGFVDVVTDATERVQTNLELAESVRALREREQRMQQVMRASNDGFWEWRLKTGQIYCSPRWNAMLGGPETEREISVDSWWQLFHQDDRSRAHLALGALRAGTIERAIAEHRLLLKDGSHRWFAMRAVASHDDDGTVTAIVGSHTDVSQRRAATESLEQRVRERTSELTALLDVSQKVVSTLEPDSLLGVILEQLRTVIDYTWATIHEHNGDELSLLAHRASEHTRERRNIKLSLGQSAVQRVFASNESVVVPDVHAGTKPALEYRELVRGAGASGMGDVGSWIAVPLMAGGRVIGILSLEHHQRNFYTPTHATLALAFANQAAVAIENARLFAQARQRADESRTLFNVQQAITRRLDPDAVLQMIADEARRLTDTEFSAVYLRQGTELEVAVIAGSTDRDLLGFRFPLESSIAGRSIANRTPFLVRDTTREPDVYRELVERVGARSFVIVPLLSGREAIGTITVANKQSATLGPEDERVLTMLASGAVIALENARLFARLEQRTLELEALYRADEELYTKLRLQDLLNTLVEVAVDILRADKSSLMVYNPDSGQLEVRAAHGFRPETLAQMTFAAEEGAVTLAASRRDIVVVEDTRREERIATRITEAENILSLMHAPIEVGERLFGVFNVSYESPRNFTEEEQRLFSALAQRAALAIENVQLQERAQEAAAAEERNRLARELHDAVTQTLFSASLIADVLPRLWEQNQAQGRERLEELRELTRGALAEMRTLLLELRPATLTEVGLNDLLRQLVEAIVGRARLPIELVVEGEELLPADVQVAFYRIAQESLNNIAKHAEAKHVHVHLRYGSGVVELRISDDGRGFDPGDVGLSSLGLRIMRERAEQIGADLHIETGPGEGTTVHVGWANANGSHNPMEHGRARA